MTASDIALVKRLEHYAYDHSGSGPKLWYKHCNCKDFNELWEKNLSRFAKCGPTPNWKQRCLDREFTEFRPYTRSAIDLKLTIYGY